MITSVTDDRLLLTLNVSKDVLSVLYPFKKRFEFSSLGNVVRGTISSFDCSNFASSTRFHNQMSESLSLKGKQGAGTVVETKNISMEESPRAALSAYSKPYPNKKLC